MTLVRTHHLVWFALAVLLLTPSISCQGSDFGGAAEAEAQVPADSPLPLPNKSGSFKFAVLGDFGNGSRAQYELAEQMQKVHSTFAYELVTLVGDNLYGGERPQDFKSKFEVPYKPLLDAGSNSMERSVITTPVSSATTGFST